MPRKKSEGKGREMTTNIKVTVPTHRELQVASEMLGKTQSEVISMALRTLLPNLTEEVGRREEIKRVAEERARQLSQN